MRNVVLGIGLAACGGGGAPAPVEPAPEPVPTEVVTAPIELDAGAAPVTPPPVVEEVPPPEPCLPYYATDASFDGDALRLCSPEGDAAPTCTTIARDGTITGPLDAPPPTAGPTAMLGEDQATVSFCPTADTCAELHPDLADGEAHVRQLEVAPDGRHLAVLTHAPGSRLTKIELYDVSGARNLTHRLKWDDAEGNSFQIAWLADHLLVLDFPAHVDGVDPWIYEVKPKKLVRLGKPIGERVSAWGVIGAGRAALLDTERVRIVDLKKGKQTQELAFDWLFAERDDAGTGARLRNEGTVRMAVRDDGQYALVALDGADARVGFASVAGGTPVIVDAAVCDE